MRSASVVWLAAKSQPATQQRRAPSTVDDAQRETLAVLRLAAALEPDPVEALAWYRSVPLAVLDGLTAAELVKQGRVHSVLTFLRAAIEIDRSERKALQWSTPPVL
ncbi:hypothetical protein [Frateuria soli]|uniref:hypothetical protein n=1 Tax=Frateuria soli TaxID=1542730 RepID=UPI001E385FFA|nr:hypothetical protein [Frateuria soli]UGB39893.1 hypothetical protein LQ771_06775 [Frateuria soli]